MSNRATEFRSHVLLLGVCLTGISACSGKALILDGGPKSTLETTDAGLVETIPVHDQIQDFWADDARLYWATESYKLQSCLHDDCEHTTITYGSTYGFKVGLGTSAVIWSTNESFDTVISCPKAGCAGAPTRVVRDTSLSSFPRFADGDYFYWGSAFDTYRCPSSGCSDIPEVVALGEVGSDLHFAGSHVYWSRWSGQQDNGHPKPPLEIRRAPKDGSEPPATILTIPLIGASWAGFAVDATTLYWFDDSYHGQSCPLETCNSEPSTPLVTTDTNKYLLKVDETGLYWVEPAAIPEEKLMFCPITGCGSEPRTVVSDASQSFALDSKYLYWAGRKEIAFGGGTGITGDQTIRRMLKPSP